KQKAREGEENKKHYQAMTSLTEAFTAELEAAALGDEEQWQALYADMTLRINKLSQKMAKVAMKHGKEGVELWQSEGGLLEEAYHGVNARIRVIHNTMTMLMDISDKCSSLSKMQLVKQAALMW
ncbi:hypothetical protein, partial [Klebsiella variicola]|uniref:hypothetical protein n=1 Tax=Klebsiella variicola TaxID=244366 RepID=UPI0034DEF9FD